MLPCLTFLGNGEHTISLNFYFVFAFNVFLCTIIVPGAHGIPRGGIRSPGIGVNSCELLTTWVLGTKLEKSSRVSQPLNLHHLSKPSLKETWGVHYVVEAGPASTSLVV